MALNSPTAEQRRAWERGVVAVTGDGHLLMMSLGCLATLAANPADLFLLVMDNGAYEVTGGQPTSGSGRVDFAGLARAAGVCRVYSCEAVEEWEAVAAEALSGPGPVLVWLKVEARPGGRAPRAMRPLPEQIERLRQALAG